MPPLNLLIGKSPYIDPIVEQVVFFDPATGAELEDPGEFLETADDRIHEAQQDAKDAEQRAEKSDQRAKQAEDTLAELRKELDRLLAEKRGESGA